MACSQCGKCCKEFAFELDGKGTWIKEFIKFLEFTRPDSFLGVPNGLRIIVKCKYLSEDNICNIYNERPEICRDFLCKKAKEN